MALFYEKTSSRSVAALKTDSCLEYVFDHFSNSINYSLFSDLPAAHISRASTHNPLSHSANRPGTKHYPR